MGALEDLTAAVEAQGKQIEQLTVEISQLRQKVAPSREVYTLADLAELPEAPSLKTLRNNPSRQPNAGQPDGYRGAQKAWLAASVTAWRRELAPAPSTFPHVVRRAREAS